ncbi:MAG: AmmeMemoRadiSam system radical SAM enzyme [candidate division WOR-3 bacterium]
MSSSRGIVLAWVSNRFAAMPKKALYFGKKGDRLVCTLCPHSCIVDEGERGLCGVREARCDELISLNYGVLIAAHIDPVEKKPLYHFLPGSESLSVAAPGCNLSCKWCQNWDISQLPVLEPETMSQLARKSVPPQEIVTAALRAGVPSISYTYTEPTIYYEYALDTMKLAKDQGIRNIWVTNGFINSRPLLELKGLLDAANVDFKFVSRQAMERWTGGRPTPVMNAMRLMKRMGVWIEVTTLLVPGVNDTDHELRGIAGFISRELGPETPWHVSGFYPAFKVKDIPPTPKESMMRAMDIGGKEGLSFIYPGNRDMPGFEDTRCPSCGATLIKRHWFSVSQNRLKEGKCPDCGTPIPGAWK